jgi:hypothetical protein
MNKVNLIIYFHKKWTVVLNDDFRNQLKERIKKQRLKIKDISRETLKSIDSIWKFNGGRYNATFGYLISLCKLLNINQNILFDNITNIYTRSKKAHLTPNQ